MTTPPQNKSELRKVAQKRRNELPIASLSERVQELLITSEVYQNAKRVATYVPLGSEVDVFTLVKSHPEKDWFLPRVLSPEHIGLFSYRHGDPLYQHHFGMMEPGFRPEYPNGIDPSDLDLILVPGLMYDAQGYRLGYGKGYYDRLLSELTVDECNTLGIVPTALITDSLPHDPWDHPVSALLTETGLRKIVL